MAVRQRGGSWQADFMVKGRRFRETFDDKTKAEAWELLAKAHLKRGQEPPKPEAEDRPAPQSEGSLRSIYATLEETRWKKQPRSYRTTMVNVKRVLEFFGPSTHVRDLTAERIEDFVLAEQDRGSANTTINHKLAVITPALKLASTKGFIRGVPAVKFLTPGGPRHRILSHDEETKVLSLFARWDEPDMVDFTVLGIETGCRLSELLGMEWDMVAEDLRRWQVQRVWIAPRLYQSPKSKSGLRRIALSPAARSALVRLRQRHPDEAGPLTFMRPDFENRWRDLWDKMRATLGLEDVVIHALRHTCASRLCAQVKDGEDITLSHVKNWMGHSTIQQTQAYVHHDDDVMDRLMENREFFKPVKQIQETA